MPNTQQEENQGLYEVTSETASPIPPSASTRDERMGAMGDANTGDAGKGVDLEPYKAKLRDLYEKVRGDRRNLDDTGLHQNELAQTGEISAADNHPGDAATDVFIRERDLTLEGNIDAILRQCERALQKIEEGTYGYSDVSGAFIGEERLDAVPYATLTVEEQERIIEG